MFCTAADGIVAAVGVCGVMCIAVKLFGDGDAFVVAFVLKRPVSGSLSLDVDKFRSCQRSVGLVADHVGDGVGDGVGVGGSVISDTHDRGLV